MFYDCLVQLLSKDSKSGFKIKAWPGQVDLFCRASQEKFTRPTRQVKSHKKSIFFSVYDHGYIYINGNWFETIVWWHQVPGVVKAVGGYFSRFSHILQTTWKHTCRPCQISHRFSCEPQEELNQPQFFWFIFLRVFILLDKLFRQKIWLKDRFFN